MDCFYAAVHVRDDPSLAGKAVVIGGRPESRGVVAAASYEARRFGIHSAMPSAQARRLCATVVFVAPDFRRYHQESERIFAIYREYTPLVQAVSIDEAYLDVTGHLEGFGSATGLAREIRYRGGGGRRGHPCPIADACGSQANVGKLSACLHFDTVERNAEALRLAVQVVAVARGEGEHQELTAIDGRTLTRRLGRNGQGLRGRAGADRHLVTGLRALDGG